MSKHIAIPYHFSEHVKKKEVEVNHISTDEQLIDLLTKGGLVEVKFESLRDKSMGWCEDDSHQCHEWFCCDDI